jgi:hypothetical protein
MVHISNVKNNSPANQAKMLFNTLAAAESPRLIVLDQFENFLDWKTGAVLPDYIGISEWLDALNSQLCLSGFRLLLTSRLRPKGAREYLPTYLQEYPVDSLMTDEGMDLLRSRGVQAAETDLRKTVVDCNGHALSLTLLVALIQDYGMSLAALLADPARWSGDIASNLLDAIFARLDDIQRDLLRAFSVYHTAVSLEAVLTQMEPVEQRQAFQALRALLAQHLIQSVGEGDYQLHIIVASYVKQHFVEGDKQANLRAVQRAQETALRYVNRQRMIERVHSIWIEGVLEPSLQGAAQIALELENKSSAIVTPLWHVPREFDTSGRFSSATASIVQVYDHANGELLILGEPGAGKTTLLLELTSTLLERARHDDAHPIPVVFPLSSWASRRQPLTQWLASELHTRYQVPLPLATAWVETDQVLPLLDGLDEVAVSNRAVCVEAINAYRQTHGLLPTVVCSRQTDYLALSTPFLLRTVVVVQPLALVCGAKWTETAWEGCL